MVPDGRLPARRPDRERENFTVVKCFSYELAREDDKLEGVGRAEVRSNPLYLQWSTSIILRSCEEEEHRSSTIKVKGHAEYEEPNPTTNLTRTSFSNFPRCLESDAQTL